MRPRLLILGLRAALSGTARAQNLTDDPRGAQALRLADVWVEAQRAYAWYLGANDLGLPLATAADGGCFDGLMPTGLNRNQGAESILALQLASCAISGVSTVGQAVAGTDRAVA